MGGGAAPSQRISAVRLTRKTPESRHKDDGWLGGLLFVFPPERPGGVMANKLQEGQRSTGATSAAVGCVEKAPDGCSEEVQHTWRTKNKKQ